MVPLPVTYAFIVTWVAEAGLAMCLEVTCDVGCAKHFATDVAGHFAFVPDHMGAQPVFGSEGGGTGRYLALEWPL